MKKYLNITFENNPKITGRYFPQLEDFEGDVGYQTYRLKHGKDVCFTNQIKKDLKIPNNVFLGIGKLKYRSKLTDVISDRYSINNTALDYLIISQKFKDLLQNFKLGEHKYFNLPILYRKEIFKYYYLVMNNVKKEMNEYADLIQNQEEIYRVTYCSEALGQSILENKISGIKILNNKILNI